MSNLSEEEIINVITKMLEKNDDIFEETGNHLYFSKMTAEAIQGLLDLYNNTKKSELILANKFQKVNIELNKEKENNKELIEGQIKTLEEILQPQLLKKYVSKDKIKERYEKLKHYDYIEINELLKLLEE